MSHYAESAIWTRSGDAVKFYSRCVRHAARGSISRANSAATLVGGAILGTLCPLLGLEVSANGVLGALVFALACFGAAWIAVFLYQFLMAPVAMDKDLRHRLADLEKLDRCDLQHLLGGCFFDDTFMYGAEVTLCKNYDGEFALRQIIDGYDTISVRAPKNSWAEIRFRFLNGHQGNSDYAFYYVDGNGQNLRIENIYDSVRVYLGRQSRFKLKLICGETYRIHPSASLQVSVVSWTK